MNKRQVESHRCFQSGRCLQALKKKLIAFWSGYICCDWLDSKWFVAGLRRHFEFLQCCREQVGRHFASLAWQFSIGKRPNEYQLTLLDGTQDCEGFAVVTNVPLGSCWWHKIEPIRIRPQSQSMGRDWLTPGMLRRLRGVVAYVKLSSGWGDWSWVCLSGSWLESVEMAIRR